VLFLPGAFARRTGDLKMRSLCLAALCALLVSVSFAEDAQLRARAFEMVERAQDVSVPHHSAPIVNETVLTFRALGSDGALHDGSYSRVFAGPNGTREEFTLGDFHLVRIALPDRLAFIGTSRVVPPEIRETLKLLPIQLWRLDQEDVVHDIVSKNRKGVDARCVEFDTIRGPETTRNELCFDAQTGTEIYARTGNTEVENSAFFDFSGAKLPGRIVRYQNGKVVTDITLARRIITDQLSPDMFTPPPTADIAVYCKTFRRAFGQSMPQPLGNGGAITEIIVHALIGTDGKVHEATIEDSERPDLNQEALKTAQSWTFTPAVCNGQPNTEEANLVIRFQGR
jgi:TonB family protein